MLVSERREAAPPTNTNTKHPDYPVCLPTVCRCVELCVVVLYAALHNLRLLLAHHRFKDRHQRVEADATLQTRPVEVRAKYRRCRR